MNALKSAIAVLTFAVIAPALDAQRVTGDLRGGYAVPTGKVSGAELDPGPVLGATIALRVQPHLHVYAGWDWVHFGSDPISGAAGTDFEETGYTFGLRFEHPIRAASRVAYRLEAGGTYKHIEIENADGNLVANSGHGLGYEAGAGLTAPLTGAWRIVPAVRYRALSREFDVGTARTTADLRYVALEIGVSRGF